MADQFLILISRSVLIHTLPWLPCVVATTEKCTLTFPSRKLHNLHHLVYHQYSTDTLKHLGLVKCTKSKNKQAPSFVGSKQDFAIIRLIVCLYILKKLQDIYLRQGSVHAEIPEWSPKTDMLYVLLEYIKL